ncbi:O-antigen polysaccharide polymerase Wzy [Chryseobacterium terrae]|uniref:O-antigen polysaccharide polymerase Wzy n=1 Tax=Chryseobacterium terrae TaxID=3163299 RepID=A0ABW8Y631_9FLAO
MNRFIIIALLVVLTVGVYMFYDFYSLAVTYFYFLLFFLIADIIYKRKINLIHVWCAGFVYIILSEAFITFGINFYKNGLDALQYLIVANNLILIGYYSNNSSPQVNKQNGKYEYTTKKLGVFLLIVCILFYITATLPSALASFALGREAAAEGENFVISSIVNSMGFLLPSVILFYFYHIKKTSLLISFLLSSPIFLILFMGGSRFPLLFSFLGFFLTYQNLSSTKFSKKKIFLLGMALVILLSASYAMKEFRTGERNVTNYTEQTEEYRDLPTYVSQYLSNEGIIDMTSLMIEHFSYHDHLYGASSSFITYFWIPRVIWEDKPTMLGHWFIRQYRGGFSQGHSASFGFTGDLFADFGYLSLLFVLFIGRLIKSAENFQDKALASNNYKVILGAMLFPYVFFFVRSPITASMTFLGILFFFFLFKKTVFKELKMLKN